jgi:uncharacterized protein (DUF488 family)
LVTLYTIGHSTRPLDEFISVLDAHEIGTVVDIRAFPASRRLPHFNRESLEKTLPETGVSYIWRKALGGYRKKIREDSPNMALRNASFRNYADYMLTPEFEQAAAELVRLAENSKTASMCAERMWFQCHRMLVSDWLAAHGHEVLHIDGEQLPKPHRLTAQALLVDNRLVYPGAALFP